MGFLSSLFHTPLGFALDFSDSSVHLLEVRGRGASDVTSSVHIEIPAGLIEDGHILDQAKVADVIRRAYAEAVPRPPLTKHVVAELPESQTFATHFTIDGAIPQKDLKQAIADRGAQSLPVNLEDHVWDYQVLATGEAGHEILFAAAPADLVEAYEQTFALAGLKLEVLELESMALTRAVVDVSKLAAESAVLVLDMGGRSSTMAFVDGLGLQLSVTMPLAGHALTDAIAKKFKITPADADKRKIKKGFADKEAGEAMRKALAPLVEEAASARRFYEQSSTRKLQTLILAGGSSSLPGLAAELEKAIGLAAEKGVPPFSIEGFEPQQIAVSAGLALRATNLTEGINFILPD